MDLSNICVIAIVIIIAVLVIRAGYVLYTNSDKYISLATEYILQYSDVIKDILIKAIDSIDVDISELTSLEDLKKLVSKESFEEIWNKIYETFATEALSLKEISKNIFKQITTTLMEDVIDDIMENDEEVVAASNNKMREIWVAAVARNQKAEEELQKKADEYETETAPFEPVEEIDIHAVPEGVELNPQTDEEGPYDESDDSQEIVSEVKEDNE